MMPKSPKDDTAASTSGPAQALLVPRWSGTGASDWYPALQAAVPGRMSICDLDRPDAPTIAGCVAALAERAEPSDASIVIGHSVGCQVVMRYLAASQRRFAHAVLVAAWLEIDEPWPTIEPWLTTPLQFEPIRANVENIHVILSTNDPFTADYHKTRSDFEQKLGAKVSVVEGGKHFNQTEEPAVLAHLQELLSA